MAEQTKLFNLDEVVAEQTTAKIVWKGQEHEIVGLTPETYLKYQRLQQNQTAASDATAQFIASLDVLYVLVPSLETHREELMRLQLPALTKLVNFVIDESGLGESAGAGTAVGTAVGNADAQDEDAGLGESTPPA